MSPRDSNRATICAALIVAGGLWCVSAAQERPAGTGAETLRARCLTCHGTDLIAQQRLSRDGWSREIDRMAGWGAAVDAADRERLLDYLAANFGVRRAPRDAGAAIDTGATVLQARCLVCHDRRLIEQQRLDAAGWRREVNKMIGWGATVTESEKEALVAHLVRWTDDRVTGKP